MRDRKNEVGMIQEGTKKNEKKLWSYGKMLLTYSLK